MHSGFHIGTPAPARRRGRRSPWLPVALLALTLAAGGCEREPAGSADTQGGDGAAGQAEAATAPVIVALGDSLTEGYGVPREAAWPSRIQRRLEAEGYPHRVVNAGVSGDTTAGGLSRTDWLLRQPVDILILELGANDGLRGIDPDSTRANLAEIIEKAQARGATVLLAGMIMPANYGLAFKREFDSIFPELAEKYDLPLIPFLLEGVAGRRDLNLPDGIHPTAEGYAIVADNVWEALEPLLERS